MPNPTRLRTARPLMRCVDNKQLADGANPRPHPHPQRLPLVRRAVLKGRTSRSHTRAPTDKEVNESRRRFTPNTPHFTSFLCSGPALESKVVLSVGLSLFLKKNPEESCRQGGKDWCVRCCSCCWVR